MKKHINTNDCSTCELLDKINGCEGGEVITFKATIIGIDKTINVEEEVIAILTVSQIPIETNKIKILYTQLTQEGKETYSKTHTVGDIGGLGIFTNVKIIDIEG